MKTLLKFNLLIAVAGMLVLGSGCQSTHKSAADLSRYHTFAILPINAKGTYQDPSLVMRLKQPVTDTITEVLTSKGYKPVPEGEADLHVNVEFNYREYQGRREERMLDLQLIDAKTKQTVWSNYRHRITDTTLSTEGARELITDMLKPVPTGSH